MALDPAFVARKKGSPLRAGAVLARPDAKTDGLWRVTHVFESAVYLMPVSSPEQARYARRPKRQRRALIEEQLGNGKLLIGGMTLPPEFTKKHAKDSSKALLIDAAKETLDPLLEQFAVETNLDRTRFTSKIVERAEERGISSVTLRKLLQRYWYFGGVEQALLSLRRGPSPGANGYEPATESTGGVSPPRRRGRQPRLAKKLGRNDFIARQEDVDDMVRALERSAEEGIKTFKKTYESYLSTEFAKRHPRLAKRFVAGKILVPVTLRQFTLCVKQHESLSEELRSNIAALQPKASARSLHATGPGDVYELDATGGQIFVVDSANPDQVLSKTTIYILIDRWSRYIVSVYVTLTPPAWEALRVAMRIAFTSRKNFKLIGVATDDVRWPPGVVPPSSRLTGGLT